MICMSLMAVQVSRETSAILYHFGVIVGFACRHR